MLTRRGQSIVEYTMIVTILMLVIFYMGTSIKRGVQSLVKVTADQIGNQQNADQDFNDTQQGYLETSNSMATMNTTDRSTEQGYIDKITQNAVYLGDKYFNEVTYMTQNTITNAGFSPTN